MDICTADRLRGGQGGAHVPLVNCTAVSAASPGGRALLGLLVVGSGAVLLSRRRGRTSRAKGVAAGP